MARILFDPARKARGATHVGKTKIMRFFWGSVVEAERLGLGFSCTHVYISAI